MVQTREQGDFCLLAGSQVNQVGSGLVRDGVKGRVCRDWLHCATVVKDGRSASLTAPNGPAQERCAQALPPSSIQCPACCDSMSSTTTTTTIGFMVYYYYYFYYYYYWIHGPSLMWLLS